ncbi:methylmalonyl-CoA epimerase [candidate division WOR-3 bacterium]|nr:methylmalonyl-CoA epimerase [candidate division WOR-3 bacterium]
MIKKIDHIGIAVEDLDSSIATFKDLLGLELVETEEVPDQKVKIAKFKVGDVDIELLQATSAESSIAKYIAKKGQGIHHIAYEVDGILKTISELEGKGARMIDKVPREGAGGKKIAFVHPKSTSNILTELCED